MDEPSTANVHGVDIESKLDIARLNYAEEDYIATYNCLSTVLFFDPRNLAARELRALTAKHLNTLSHNGLADAEFLIEAEPHRAHPYFILIDIFLSRGRLRDALQLARTSTFRVYHTDPELGKLRSLYAKLQQTHHNLFVELPPEVLYYIFTLVPFKALVNCMSVSKRWREVLTRLPDIWNTIDFGKTYNEDSVMLALKTFSGCSNVRKLRVPAFDRTIGSLMQLKFRRIRQLDLGYSRVPLDHLLLVLAMREVGQSWRNVSFTRNVRVRVFFAAAAHFCPNLTEITISQHYLGHAKEDIEGDILGELDPSLELGGTVSLKTLVLDQTLFDISTLRSIFPRCTSLQDLTVKDCNPMVSNQELFRSMVCLPALQSITIKQNGLTDHYMSRFGDDWGDLCTLLATKPPAVLDVTECSMEREVIEKISSIMRHGIFKRYGTQFRMDNEEDRIVLQMKSKRDRTRAATFDMITIDLTPEFTGNHFYIREPYDPEFGGWSWGG